ncbi:MAG: hypothetical protein ABR568_00915 [Pyrinomonadaceae bacterium]
MLAGEKTKDVGAAVGDKAEDVKDTTVKGTKVAAKKTKAVGKEAAEREEADTWKLERLFKGEPRSSSPFLFSNQSS